MAIWPMQFNVKHHNFYFNIILHINKKIFETLSRQSNCQFVGRNMISNNSFNTNDFNVSSYKNSSLLVQEEEESYDVPIIVISVSVAIIAVICGIGIAIEIRDRRRKKQIARMSSKTSRNPTVDRRRYILIIIS